MSRRILIVDDSRTTLEVVKVHLMNQGYEFATASNAAQALELAQSKEPALVVSDLVMPDANGIALCKRIRSLPALQWVPFVLVTSSKDETLKREAFAAGIDAYIRKPIDSVHLKLLVANLLDR